MQGDNIYKYKNKQKKEIHTGIKIVIAIFVYLLIIFFVKKQNDYEKAHKVIEKRWVHNVDGTWSYSVDGKNIHNEWYNIDGKMYHFNWEGKMETDQSIDSYYVGEDGAAITNQWKRIIAFWYYYGEDGKYYIDKFLLYNNEMYYFDKSGAMVENKWVEYEGKKYHFDKNGAMQKNQYIKLGKDGLGYLTGDGSLLTNGTIDKYVADTDGYLSLMP